MNSERKKFNRDKRARILWFGGLMVFLLAYWWVMTNRVIQDFYDPQYVMKYERLRAEMKEYPGHPLWLIMGTSRVERGLRPSMFEESLKDKNAPMIFNFGMGGANMFREYIGLRRVLEAGIKPQRVGIEIVGAIMSHEVFEIADSPQLLVRAREDELEDYASYSNEPPVFMSNWQRSRCDPTYEYGMKLANQTLMWRLLPLPGIGYVERSLAKVRYDKWGWDPSPPGPTPLDAYRDGFAIATRQFSDKFTDFKISRKTDVPLRKILEMCKSAGIEVFLMKMPEGNDFHAMYTPKADAAIESYLTKIEAEYGVPMIDASSWVGPDGFSDGHHMNATGAADFTKLFGEALFKTAKASPAR